MSASDTRNRGAWLVRCSQPSQGERLLCFPYAGGNPYLFREWPAHLGEAAEVLAVQAPGKGARMLEPPCTTVAELVEGLIAAIEPTLSQRPFSFFGHSNGALVAFELACQLQRRGLPMPRHLFLSGSPAPWTRTRDRNYADMPEDEFVQVLRDLQGTPEEVLGDRELLKVVLPGLRADFALGDHYRFTHATPLDMAATLIHGDDDSFGVERTLAWQQQLARPSHLHRLPGGHFFLHSHLRELTALVAATLRDGPAARAETQRNPYV